MWYLGSEGNLQEIGYADSTDGINWTKSASNPVLQVGAAGTWEAVGLDKFCVLNVSGMLRMWYRAYSGTNGYIGYADSTDGISWNKYAHNPVMSGIPNTWERHDNLDPCVLFNGTGYQMWYTGVDDSSYPWIYKIGYAESHNNFPNAPELLSPFNDNWCPTNTPTFSWSFSDPDPYDAQTAFEIQLDDSPDFGSMYCDTGKIDSNATAFEFPEPIPDGIYYWRARVWDSDGDNGSWSAAWLLKIDMTPPLNPDKLSSPTHAVGQWSAGNTIEVDWSLPPGGALVSGYDGFSYAWDTDPSTIPDIIPESPADATSAISPPMPDGNSIYFHIRARDRAGNWAAGAAHLGPFWVDATPPENPADVASGSHIPNRWSATGTIDVNWTAAEAGVSGLAGYSCLWDDRPGTLPIAEVNLSAGVHNTSSPPLADGDSWFFHLRTEDNAGNWAPDAVTVGPYLIDASPPSITNLTINGGADFASCRTARAVLQAWDPPGGSGLSGARHRIDGGNWSDWEPYADSFMFDMNGTDGRWTVDVQVMDGANNTSPVATASVVLDTGVPSVAGLRINGGSDFTNTTSVVLDVAAADPEPSSGVILMSMSADGRIWDPWLPYCGTQPYNLTAGDGPKKVFVRLRDRAGNIGPVTNATITLDTTPPVALLQTLPATADDWNFSVSWTGADGTSGVGSFDVQLGEDNGPWTDWLQNTSLTSAVFTGQDGHAYSFRARAHDRAGNTGPFNVRGADTVLVNIPRPVVVILKPSAKYTISGQYTFAGTASHPKAGLSVVRVEVSIDDGSWTAAKGMTGWTFSYDTGRLTNGQHTISARSFDGTNYSPVETRDFITSNEHGSTIGGYLPIVLIVVVVVLVVGLAVFLGRRGREIGRGTGGPGGPAPQNYPGAQARTGAPPSQARVQAPYQPAMVPVPGRASAEDETIRGPNDKTAEDSGTSTEARPAGAVGEGPAPSRADDEMAQRENRALQAVTSLPRGLPASLWGVDMDALAAMVVRGERDVTPGGSLIVKINNHWYYGDEKDLGTFLQEYKNG